MDQPRVRGLRLLMLAVAAIAGFLVNLLFQESAYWWAALPALVLVGLGAMDIYDLPKPRSLFRDKRHLHDDTVKSLISQTSLQKIEDELQALYGTMDHENDDHLRITVHLTVRRRDCSNLQEGRNCQTEWSLVQLTNYVARNRTGKYRVFSVYAGALGRCFRTSKPQTVNFEDGNEYGDRMVLEFGYLPGQAHYHTTTARSYLCWPMGEGEVPLAILFLDAETPNFFPEDPLADRHVSAYRDACRNIVTELKNDTLVSAARDPVA